MTNEQAEALESFLEGTASDVHTVAELLGLDEEESLKAIADRANVDCCTSCGWWSRMEELNDSGGDLVCDECMEGDKE